MKDLKDYISEALKITKDSKIDDEQLEWDSITNVELHKQVAKQFEKAGIKYKHRGILACAYDVEFPQKLIGMSSTEFMKSTEVKKLKKFFEDNGLENFDDGTTQYKNVYRIFKGHPKDTKRIHFGLNVKDGLTDVGFDIDKKKAIFWEDNWKKDTTPESVMFTSKVLEFIKKL